MAAAAGEIIQLVHYTQSPIKGFTKRPTNAQTTITIRTGKPAGFWYSYYGAWKTELNRSMEHIYEYIIGVPTYQFTEDITAASLHSILRLTGANITGFIQLNHDDSFIESRCPGLVYPCSGYSRYGWLDFWEAIAARWGGIEFTESLKAADKRIPVLHGKYGAITVDISEMIAALDIFPSGVLFHPELFQGDKPLAPKEYNADNFFKNVAPSVRRRKTVTNTSAKKNTTAKKNSSAKKVSPPRITAKNTTAKKVSPPRITAKNTTAKKASPPRTTVKNTTAKKNGKATTALLSSLLKKK